MYVRIFIYIYLSTPLGGKAKRRPDLDPPLT